MSSTRNLIVLFDGTWNTPEKPLTNVGKFAAALASCDGKQRIHYEEGVGTGLDDGLSGGVLSIGIKQRLLEGYGFIQERFADEEWKPEDNRIFILGFSRGAYTARLLARLIEGCGIPLDINGCNEGLEHFWSRLQTPDLKDSGRFISAPVEMLGIWDTVKSAPGIGDYTDLELPLNVAACYHAMAIDERRADFPVLRWRSSDDSRLTERWFAGVHSDVGGGYPDSHLADVTLRWMIDKGCRHGLKFKKEYVLLQNIKPDALDKQHESYEGFFVARGTQARNILDGDFIHPSVEQRIAGIDYHPAAAQWPLCPRYAE